MLCEVLSGRQSSTEGKVLILSINGRVSLQVAMLLFAIDESFSIRYVRSHSTKPHQAEDHMKAESYMFFVVYLLYLMFFKTKWLQYLMKMLRWDDYVKCPSVPVYQILS